MTRQVRVFAAAGILGALCATGSDAATVIISQRTAPLHISSCQSSITKLSQAGGKSKYVSRVAIRSINASSDTIAGAVIAVFGMNGSGDIVYWTAVSPAKPIAPHGAWPYSSAETVTSNDSNLLGRAFSVEAFACAVSRVIFEHREGWQDNSIAERLAAVAGEYGSP